MYSFFLRVSRVMAILGGLMLSFLIVLTCVSILGRMMNGALHGDLLQALMPDLADRLIAAGVGSIFGDFELVEAGMAFAIFAFLPLCQITGGHAAVDVFTTRMAERPRRWLYGVTDIVFALVLVLIAVQLFEGMQSKLRSGQTTFILEFPVWWAYALSLVGAVVAAIVATYIAVMRIVELASGRLILPADLGAGH